MAAAFVTNPLRRPCDRPPRLNLPRAFHERLPGYGPTPLLRLRELAAELGVAELWVKDESARMGLRSYDILGASWALYRAVLERVGKRPARWADLGELREWIGRSGMGASRVAVVGDSEFAVAAATAAAWFGFDCTAYLAGGGAPARIDAVRATGATVDAEGLTYDEALYHAVLATDADSIVLSDSSFEDDADVPVWVTEGFTTVFEEVDDEVGRRRQPPPDVAVLALGVGALAASAGLHYRVEGARDVVLIGAEPALAPCFTESALSGRRTSLPAPAPSVMDTLSRGLPSRLAWDTVGATFDGFVAVDDDAATQAVALLEAHGVRCTAAGAAPVAAVPAAVDRVGPDARVLVVVGEGRREAAR